MNSQGVEYLVVGGYAMAYHGVPRFTGDVDFLVASSPENASRIERALAAFGFGSPGLSAKDFTVPGRVIQLGRPPNRIGLLTSISGVPFEEAWRERVPAELDGVPVNFIGREALIRNKRATARAQDLADLEVLT